MEIFAKHYPDYEYCETPKDKPADIDAILIKQNQIMRVVETKCRDLTIEEFIGRFNYQWLVTFDKLEKGRRISHALQVPFIGFLYLMPSDLLLVQQIANEYSYVPEITLMQTETQKTINGGRITRSNAYIDMSNATQLK
jgi:uncharacterized protein (DUF849 family)